MDQADLDMEDPRQKAKSNRRRRENKLLSIQFWNAGGIRASLVSLTKYMLEIKPDIMVVLETQAENRKGLNIHGYDLWFVGPKKNDSGAGRPSGGTVVYIRRESKVVATVDVVNATHRKVWIHVYETTRAGAQSKQGRILAIYAPTSGADGENQKWFFDLVAEIQTVSNIDNPEWMVIGGDFNARLGHPVGDANINENGKILADILARSTHAHLVGNVDDRKQRLTYRTDGGGSVIDHIILWKIDSKRLFLHPEISWKINGRKEHAVIGIKRQLENNFVSGRKTETVIKDMDFDTAKLATYKFRLQEGFTEVRKKWETIMDQFDITAEQPHANKNIANKLYCVLEDWIISTRKAVAGEIRVKTEPSTTKFRENTWRKFILQEISNTDGQEKNEHWEKVHKDMAKLRDKEMKSNAAIIYKYMDEVVRRNGKRFWDTIRTVGNKMSVPVPNVLIDKDGNPIWKKKDMEDQWPLKHRDRTR